MTEIEPILQKYFANDPLVVVDVGARNFATTIGMEDIRSHAACYGFEPSPQSQNTVPNLNSLVSEKPPKAGDVNIYPVALGPEDGTLKLNLMLNPGATSSLEPHPGIINHYKKDNWAQWTEKLEQIEVPSMRLKSFVDKVGIPAIDFIKLDTQGTELDILKSADDYLDNISVIKAEVEIVPLYDKQPLMHEVTAFLYEKGFELIDIGWVDTCRRFHSRPDLDPDSYRLTWVDAIYAKRPYDFQKPELLKQAFILDEAGYHDLAIYQIRNHPGLTDEEKRVIENYFSRQPARRDLKGWVQHLIWKLTGVWITRYKTRTKQLPLHPSKR